MPAERPANGTAGSGSATQPRQPDSFEVGSELINAVLDGTVDAVFIKDLEGRYQLINAAGATMLGRPSDQILGFTDADLFEAEALEGLRRRDAEALAAGKPVTSMSRATAAGVTRSYVTTRTPWRGRDGRIMGIIGVSRDISESRRMRAELVESQQRYKDLLESLPLIVYRCELEPPHRLIYVSKGIESLGYEHDEWIDSPDLWRRSLYPADKARVLRETAGAIADGRQLACEYRIVARDGTVRWVHDSARIIQDGPNARPVWQGIIADTTERRELEERLMHSHKMEAIGRFAAGVAHDFNNLLTVISGSAEFLLNSNDDPALVQEDARAIADAATRAAALTRQLLAFGRKQLLKPRVMDVNDVIVRLDAMLRRIIGEDIYITTTLRPRLWPVFADAGQLEQVVLNIAVNARDAMPQGGSLVIATDKLSLHAGDPRLQGIMPPGDYVRLTISDTGRGMDEATSQRIFEPFFTTKELGRGTGLGLSTVYGIVKQSGGYIWIDSTLGEGSTFTIYLPRTAAHEESPQQEADDASRFRGTEKILLIEDEEGVRSIAERLLTSMGYSVVCASSSQQALQISSDRDEEFDLVVSDVVMPGMSGPEVVALLHEQRPHLRFMYMSGYPATDVARHGLDGPDVIVLQKPFSRLSLGQAVRSALDGIIVQGARG